MEHVEILAQVAKDYGVFAALFIGLLVWVLHTNNQREKRYIEREERYIQVIDKLTNSLKIVKDLKEDMQAIKQKLGV